MKDARRFFIQEEGAVMKISLIHLLTLMTLATSMSAFALPARSNAARNGNSSTASGTKPASASSDVTGSEKGQGQQDQEKARQQLIEQQDKQWLHDLQGIFGG
jgi:hypothetical protein